MITTRDIQKMIKHISRRSSGRPDKRLIHPAREWGIGLLIFFLVLVGGGLYNLYSHLSFSDLETTLTEPETNIVRYQSKTIETALTTFRERKLNYQSLQANFIAPVAAPAEADSDEVSETTDIAVTETEDELTPSTATDTPAPTEDSEPEVSEPTSELLVD